FLEAMAAGKPIVAANAAAIPEVVQDGILVEPNNAEALADGIHQLWRDPARRAQIAARQRVTVERYDLLPLAQQFSTPRAPPSLTRPGLPSVFASIHRGGASRSSSGRFMANAATTRPSASHHTLKILPPERSPRTTCWSAAPGSPHNSYDKSNTSEKK